MTTFLEICPNQGSNAESLSSISLLIFFSLFYSVAWLARLR